MNENALLASLSHISDMIVSNFDRAQSLNPILARLNEEVGAKYSLVATGDPDTGAFKVSATAGLTASQFRHLDGSAAQEWLSGLAEIPHSMLLTADNRIRELPVIEECPAAALVISPIRISKRTFGVICIGFDAVPVDDAKAPLLRTIAIVSSILAQNFRVEMAVLGERERLREENLQLKSELKEKYEFSHLVGNSSAMRQVYEQVTQVARSNATVLLRGESGTGKEMIANAIHYNSLRSKRPFIKVNCAALPDSLIESELFGHEKGAFTGADRFRKGRFDMADGGTLFLDEIGDIPLQTQIKLLRVLQEREFERLGGTETIRTNIRLIVATNKNLEEAIARGEFREDLYYRLNVFSIFLPPLRERKSDVLLLAEHFLEKYEIEHGKRIRRISTPAIDMLMSYHFPGNVRELENAIERAVLVCDASVIHGHHLPPTLQTAEVSGTETNLTLSSAIAAFERDMIQDALKSSRGNISGAARQLGSTERILGYKIRKYSIDTGRFRQ